jgi:hypothetical protein
MTKEEIADHINNIIAAQGTCKRVIIWHFRYLRELRKLEGWLRDEQRKINPIIEEA